MSPAPTPDLTLDGLVHDLSNVFETIGEAADVMAKDPKYARLAAALRRSVGRGERILGSFFEHSQASLDLDLILDGAVESVADFLQAVKRPQIEFVRDLEPGLRLRGNPAGWERVFVNLFLNAAQAIEEGGIVQVSASRSPTAVEIEVADNGPGISLKVLPHIFEPRFSTRARRSGLGLHIVQTIVRQNGGSVTAANCPSGRGAVFQLSCPIQDPK